MEENNSKKNYTLPIGGVLLLAVATISVYIYQKSAPPASEETIQNTPTPAVQAKTPKYENGTYSANGEYISPGGPRDVSLTVTLTDGVVTDSLFEGHATDPTSMRFQGEFTDNYQPLIIGKNIDEIALTKVSGSSLTSKGFTDALEKIKLEAQN